MADEMNLAAVADFEKLGAFYLGRPHDLAAGKASGGPLLYDSRDLLTHAVCVGMTGSGKTGLCIGLIEEALIDGVPVIAIDPKGDLANLLLTFPALRPEDFAPWVDPGEARRKSMTPEAFAAAEADKWRQGLASWGMDGARIARLRAAAELRVLTPGSSAGLPVSILKSFAAPPEGVRGDGELMGARIGTAVAGLLGLVGVDADPLRSREHILLATLLGEAWRAGRAMDLAALIGEIQNPPVARIGALELESFFPAKDRFALAALVNNLLASPTFGAWLTGEPLDIDAFLHAPDGRPRCTILSIAHLGEPERMLVVSLVLGEMLAWVRTQSGTGSLRAILYMDEIFGYVPPVANPPSKLPLLTLLKQARAFGLGIVLATQNPVDLDYKGLANTGTWLVGRLQTERDKARLLDGLEGASAASGGAFDRSRMDAVLSGLGARVFLLNNVHEDAPVVFQTRWAMSYLAGPMTRDQIARLMAPVKAGAGEAAAMPAATVASPPAEPPAVAAASPRPVLPPGIPEAFVPPRGAPPAGALLAYSPVLLGCAAVRFADGPGGARGLAAVTGFLDGPLVVDWSAARMVPLDPGDLEAAPRPSAAFAALPAPAAQARSYGRWQKDFADWLYGSQRLDLLRHAGLKETSRPGESERDFRVRLQELARERRDEAAARLKAKYTPRLAGLEERLRRARQAVERETGQAQQKGVETVISVGATILGAFLGRKTLSASSLGRASTAARSASRTLKERQDVARAGETVAALEAEIADQDEAFKADLAALPSSADILADPLEAVPLKPKKADIDVRLVTLAWLPHWQSLDGAPTPAWE